MDSYACGSCIIQNWTTHVFGVLVGYIFCPGVRKLMLMSYRNLVTFAGGTFASGAVCFTFAGAEYRILAPEYWPFSSDTGEGVWSIPSFGGVPVGISGSS